MVVVVKLAALSTFDTLLKLTNIKNHDIDKINYLGDNVILVMKIIKFY